MSCGAITAVYSENYKKLTDTFCEQSEELLKKLNLIILYIIYIYIYLCVCVGGCGWVASGGIVVKALRYKPTCPGFDS